MHLWGAGGKGGYSELLLFPSSSNGFPTSEFFFQFWDVASLAGNPTMI
jgi:hypothetical protein